MFDNIKINVYSFIFLICYHYIISFCHKSFPSFHHAHRTWLYSAEPYLMFDSLSFQLSLLRTKLHSIRIWFLMNLSANPNIFSLSTCVDILCYDYRINNSIPAMLVFVLTSGCNSNCIAFLQLNWLSVDQHHILFQIHELINFFMTMKLSYKSKMIVWYMVHLYSPVCRQVFHFAQNNMFHWVDLSADPNRASLSTWVIGFHVITLDNSNQQSCFKPSRGRPNYFFRFHSQ